MIDGVLRTAPADGRLLPGITRAVVLRAAACGGITTKEMPISRRQLLEASEVFVTNSVHGVVSALALADGAAAWEAGPIASRLRGALASGLGSAPSLAASRCPSGTQDQPHATALAMAEGLLI